MSTPNLNIYTPAQIKEKITAIEQKIHPTTIEILQRLRDASALTIEEENLLEEYESLSWLIGE